MNPVVAVIAPGMMGAAVGGRLVENGLKVLTSLTGRSADTIARAKQYGLTTALQSTNSGLLLLAVSAGAKRWESATASPGGKMDKMKSVRAISSSLAETMPAASARALVSALRPLSEVSTLRP